MPRSTSASPGPATPPESTNYSAASSCTDPACKLDITGGLNRPPMERKPGTVALYKQARKLAAELGFALDEAATGGGSDGNFTAALGVPTLDGLGAVGEGAHAAHESHRHRTPRPPHRPARRSARDSLDEQPASRLTRKHGRLGSLLERRDRFLFEAQ